ncbi:hypothetical protein KWH04_16035 [Xanthomonas campestris pv. trichodesmae]|uniref:Phage-related protein n=1 Tax=Xanthomonas citri pv. vignicola TaxID=473426 RepID=A0AB33CQX5_XANCI|nr:hypothetical protein [Xanthomonas citri]ASK92668.1 hypothetical protein XcvCFBP7111P_15240 [Xanthomonas citri pv. vignicola]MBV6782121.1 hypothetical protein [Xanthomonas campestris pv. trichodesmae]
MRERPIRLKAHEVRAILSGAKSQTRHVVKPAPDARADWMRSDVNSVWHAGTTAGEVPGFGIWQCPFGQPGDRLWVRETWQQVHPLQVAAGRYSHEGRAGIPGPPPVSYRTIYRADGEFPPIYMLGGEPWPYRSLTPFERNGMQSFVDDPWWNPSVHMPRWACRLVLEITDVRVERLQAISEVDALAEAAMEWAGEQDTPIRDLNTGDERIAFKALWNSTGGNWDANPWVWVISFRRLP